MTALALRRAGVALGAVLVASSIGPAASLFRSGQAFAAATGTDGPGGTVTVGAGSGSSSGGAPSGPGGGGSNGGSGGSSSPWTCTYTLLALNTQALPPGGPIPGAWYSVTCVDSATGAQTTQTEWISSAAPSSPGVPPVDPYSLALQAEKSIVLPNPVIGTDPAATSVVNLDTWLWIDPGVWHTYQVTASAGPVSATASATPISVTWSLGDGARVTCEGPGTPYDTAVASALQSTDCSHRYSQSSVGQPSPDGNPNDAAYAVTATISWSVTWTAEGAPGGGILPALSTSSTTSLRVEQVQSIETSAVRPGPAVPTPWRPA